MNCSSCWSLVCVSFVSHLYPCILLFFPSDHTGLDTMSDFEPVPAISQGKIPPELSFENIIKNKTASPCSLADFMNYLCHVEHNAENLQFFLWYSNYVQRWSQLLPRQKALSPAWDPEKVSGGQRSKFITYSHKRARSLKMNKIISIMGSMSSASEDDIESRMVQPGTLRTLRKHSSSLSSVSSNTSRSTTGSHKSISSVSTNITTTSHNSSLLSPSSTTITTPKQDLKPFTIPPHKTEQSLVLRHYLTSPSHSPRFLSLLSARDQQSCLQAAQHTTHPSALLPAFLACEAVLRSKSHPKFIRWACKNANDSRLRFLKCVALVFLLIGFGMDVVLVLSGLSPVYRTFGGGNDTEGEWGKGRVWDDTVPVEDKGVMMMQDRVVLFAVLWGGVLATGMTVGSLFLPRGDLF
ncbi:hypothetical protein QBC44DRAFT_297466 [Cladorrhinum sp. PSN332]|nr:hypothetical protein QBC44DRAFT_297466 [Cladorrhinum sp. PSN332]